MICAEKELLSNYEDEKVSNFLARSLDQNWVHGLFQNWFTTYKVWEGGKKLAFLGLSPKPEKKTPKI